jgi:predicted Zn-dependent protease
LIGAMNARSYHRGTSALTGKLGSRLIDERLTLKNRPDHAKLLGDGFDGQGMPSDLAVWIDRGSLARLRYDRFTALQQNTSPTHELDAPHLSGRGASSAEELLRGVARGILVTNFWYIRSVNPTDLTVTGMTRDGTFLIENGRIVGGLHNFRFHDSPLRVFNALDGFTDPADSVSQEQGKKLLPAVLVRDFNLSSVSEF